MNPEPRELFTPRYKRRLPVRRNPVTVCIAAIADRHNAIVSCVDTRISTKETSIDTPVGAKMRGYAGWTVLSSGTTCYSERFFSTFRGLMEKRGDNEPDTVRQVLEETLTSELQKFCAERYLLPFGIDMKEFLSSTGPKDKLPDEIGRAILDYSDQYDVELIVSGWGRTFQEKILKEREVATASIFSVSRNGVVPHSTDGFYACGSGAPSAYSMMAYFHYDDHTVISRAIYYVAAQSSCPKGRRGSDQTLTYRYYEGSDQEIGTATSFNPTRSMTFGSCGKKLGHRD
jgi:hypothetical protein